MLLPFVTHLLSWLFGLKLFIDESSSFLLFVKDVKRTSFWADESIVKVILLSWVVQVFQNLLIVKIGKSHCRERSVWNSCWIWKVLLIRHIPFSVLRNTTRWSRYGQYNSSYQIKNTEAYDYQKNLCPVSIIFFILFIGPVVGYP